LLDNLVLDVTNFLDEHPGGKFSLEHNIGKDVSKFFHGGYSLENLKKVNEHRHSNDARMTVSRLIVGRLESQPSVKLMNVKNANRYANLSGTTKTFEFSEYQNDSDEYK
jgi:cytochrome b involved in lipid metabolism